MRIRLRPYHPTWVVGYFGVGSPQDCFTRKGIETVLEKIKADPEIEVEFVEEYDDVCLECTRRVEDEKGSVWGPKHSCPSSRAPNAAQNVGAVNKRVLDALGLEIGSVIKLKDLVPLLRERIPVLEDDAIGGPDFQEKYEKGLAAFSALW